MLISRKGWRLPRVGTSQLLCVNGCLLPNKGMSMPSKTSVRSTTTPKIIRKQGVEDELGEYKGDRDMPTFRETVVPAVTG